MKRRKVKNKTDVRAKKEVISLFDEMRIIRFAQGRGIFKSLVAESIKILGVGDTVLDDEPCHGSRQVFAQTACIFRSLHLRT